MIDLDLSGPVLVFSVAVDVVLVLLAWWHLLLSRRNPAAKLLWMVVVVVLPLVGAPLYVAFGVDRHGRRATAKELLNVRLREQLAPSVGLTNARALSGDGPTESPLLPLETHAFPTPLDPLAMLLARVSRFRAIGGNRVEVLDRGTMFEEELAAIALAKCCVVLETYIFDTDVLGQRMLAALVAASERGVRCLLLIDAIGSIDANGAQLAAARARGVRIETFDQRAFLRGRFQVNLRNHRKLLVLDGQVAFVGSTNISARHLAETAQATRSDDLQTRLQGPAVAQLSAVFAEDWYSTTGEALTDEVLFPPTLEAGEAIARVIPSGPDGDYGVFHQVFVAAIYAAQRSVRIVTPYFLPSEVVSTALEMAALRGLTVSVVVPRRTDSWPVTWAMHAHFAPLLERGVEIRRRPGAFLHAKLLVIDDAWVLYGSSNVDPRSFWLNYELNVGVAGAAGVEPLRRWEETIRAEGEVVDPVRWRGRRLVRQAWENLWALASPML